VYYSKISQETHQEQSKVWSINARHLSAWTIRTYYEHITKYYELFCLLWPTNAQLSHKLSHCYMFRLSCHPQRACNQYLAMLYKNFKCICRHSNCKLYYEKLLLKYLC